MEINSNYQKYFLIINYKKNKSNYDNDKTNRSAERLNDKSTENSPSPFRSPQPATKLLS